MTESSNGVPRMRPAEIVTRSHWQDPNEVRVANWIREWDGAEELDAAIVGVPLARAAIKQVGANYAPNAVRQTGFFFTTYSIDFDVDLRDMVVRDLGDVDVPLIDVEQAHANVAEAATAIFAHRPAYVPVFVGGDHSIMRPIVHGLAAGRPDVERIGIVHFDAHLDAQVLDFCGPHNGTPLRGLLGDGVGVEARNIAQIGISGFVNGGYYRDYVREQGTTVFSARDVARGDIEAIVAEAHAIAADGTDAVYVTFDIDCMELAYAPGTGASISGGLNAWQAIEALYALGRQEDVVALEVSEIDPTRDFGDMTSRLGMKLILSFLAGVHQRATRPTTAATVASTTP
ncbi:MAG TPA: agmatinase family protein [Thermoleophilaceae bacterium]|nr:agmatinase family protein [Thermoleophilaceae bacterium]